MSPQQFQSSDRDVTIPLRRFPTALGVLYCATDLMATLASEAQAGYVAKPWGGVERGGVLLGTRAGGPVTILEQVEAECEHEYGPAFELTAADKTQLAALLERLSEGEREIVGWYRTTSKELAMTASDTELAESFFGRPGQLTLVLKRGKDQEPVFGWWQRTREGAWQFALECSAGTAVAKPVTVVEPVAVELLGEEADVDREPSDPVEVRIAEEADCQIAAQHLGQPVAETDMDARSTEQTASPPVEVRFAEDADCPAADSQSAPQGLDQPVAEAEPDAGEIPADAVDSQLAVQNQTEVTEDPEDLNSERPHSDLEALSVAVEDAFTSTPDPRFWISTRTHQDAFDKLSQGIQMRKGCLLLLGAAGTGKTFVLEHLAESMKDAGVEFAFVTNSRLNAEQFFELLGIDLDLACRSYDKVPVLMALQQRVLEAAAKGSTVTIVVDNAHRLAPEVLEEIDLLGNFESRRGKLLQIVLAGDVELEEKVRALSSLQQRIGVRVKLAPLDEATTEAYIRGRVEKAGASADEWFEGNAMHEIWSRTGGVPRLINMLALALVERPREQERKPATAKEVEQVAQEMELDRRVTR